jgi:hypothetical protein
MTRRALTLQIIGVTILALLIAFFWALDPMLTAIFMLTRPGITDAELIREIWHVRLVQPEWISGPGQLFKWMEAEAGARLSVVFLGWLASVFTLVKRHYRGTAKSSNQSLEPTAGRSEVHI